MLSTPDLLFSARRHRRGATFSATLAICSAIAGQAPAQAPYDNQNTSEGWAWARIKEGNPADLNARCLTPPLDPRASEEPGWTNSCRQLSATFLVDVLTRAPWRDQVPSSGVSIIGARIVGDIDLRNTKINRALLIERSRVENNIALYAARSDSVIGFVGSRVAGIFYADQLRGEMSLILENSEFKQGASLNHARIDSLVAMDGATFDGDLAADSLQVGASLFMRSTEQNKASFKGVALNGAIVTGNVEMDGATFDGDLVAVSLQVGASLWMRSTKQNKASFKGATLNGAKVTGQVAMDGATFDGDLAADSLQVGASLFMRSTEQNNASFKGVTLNGANVTGNVELVGATFDGDLAADSLQVGASLFMHSTEQNKASFKGINLNGAKVTGKFQLDGATFDGHLAADSLQVGASLFMRDTIGAQSVSMIFARVGGNVDIRGSTLAELDISGAFIGGELRLGVGLRTATYWRTKDGKPGDLILNNTRIANLSDEENAWPSEGHLRLDGFSFGRLGGFEIDTGREMRRRGMSWWDNWARRDPAYSPTPYEQLAAALVAAGDRDAADETRFLGRVRQRETETNWWLWIFSGILQYGAGFGIGDYTFRVLYWVIGISVAGAVYLWTCVPAAQTRGPIWCLGASLARLLPVIEVNKEFTEFFNDPDRKRLTGWQSFVFSLVGLVGWVLGLILLAAISGLTQKQ